MDIALIYLIGCLLGFGITHTFTIPYGINDIPHLSVYTYGTLCSWITVILFLLGLIMGIYKYLKGGEDAD